MIFCEIKQDTYEADTISFAGKIISDSASGFSDFQAGDKILVSGSLNGSNDVQRTIRTATNSELTLNGDDLTAQAAGVTIKIQKIEFFGDPDEYRTDARGKTQFFFPAIMNISDVSFVDDGGFIKLNDGAISINRKMLLGDSSLTKFDLQDKTKNFQFWITAQDGTILFRNILGIIRNLDEMTVDFQIKTEKYEDEILLPAPDINNPAGFTQGRFYQRLIGSKNYLNPLLSNDTTFTYFRPAGLLYNVRDDGVIVPFQGVTTSGYATPGTTVVYNNRLYSRSGAGNATMSPTGAASNNAEWNYVSPAGGDTFFALTGATFQLFSAPIGEVTCKIGSAAASFATAMNTFSALIAVPGNFIVGDGIAFDNANLKITDTEKRLGIFFGAGTSITGQQIVITGGANDGLRYVISSVASDGSEIVLTSAPINEAAGTTIKIQGYFGLDYANNDSVYGIDDLITTQTTALDRMKEYATARNHIFYADLSRNVIVSVGKSNYSEEINLTEFEIDLEGNISFLTKNVISKFFSRQTDRYPISSPVSLTTIETLTSRQTGVFTGTEISVDPFYGFSTTITGLILDAKVSLYLNTDRIEINYTIDGIGIDTRLKPGVKINFEGWINGELFIEEVIWQIQEGRNIVRGLAKNITFSE